jgi:DNA invertase Pin-like site-specific DNA recombinase
MMKTKQKQKSIATCLRISHKTQEQDSEGEAVARWIAANGIDPDKVEFYADIETGRKMDRPEFDRLQRDIFAGTAKTVVVFKVDRFACRLREGLNVLCDWC